LGNDFRLLLGLHETYKCPVYIKCKVFIFKASIVFQIAFLLLLSRKPEAINACPSQCNLPMRSSRCPRRSDKRNIHW